MYKSSKGHVASSRRSVKEENQNCREVANASLVNCGNKTNHCNRYLSDALLSGQNRSKLSIDDESSHPINGSNTNNKSVRKRNINMLNDGEKKMCKQRMSESGGDVRDSMKRIKVDGNVDGQDDSRKKMYQVSTTRANENFCHFLSRTFPIPF